MNLGLATGVTGEGQRQLRPGPEMTRSGACARLYPSSITIGAILPPRYSVQESVYNHELR
jgi:hypothetical protein